MHPAVAGGKCRRIEKHPGCYAHHLLALHPSHANQKLSELTVYLHFQLAERTLEELIDELDIICVQKFAQFIPVRLEQRCLFMKSAQEFKGRNLSKIPVFVFNENRQIFVRNFSPLLHSQRLPHAKNQLSAPGSFFNQFVYTVYSA